MEKISTSWLIHIFALLHLVTAVLCRSFGMDDTLLLTLLTMTLTVLICLRERISIEFTALSIVLVNIIGYVAGIGLAALIRLGINNAVVEHGISTLLTTEMLGWGMYYATKLKAVQAAKSRNRLTLDTQAAWVLIAVGVIYIIRVLINIWANGSGQSLRESTGDVLGTAIALLIFVADIIFISISAQKAMEAERAKADKARFQYINLKQQVNPHFLFNSLNVLDALVYDGTREEASTYIHKLAGIYRYMLRDEGEDLVSLSDELDFTGQYLDLMRVRFPSGLDVSMDVKEDDLRRNVVPCAVQLLVENATKHNAFSAAEPLHINISTNHDTVTITNNLMPRLTPSSSTGLGLSYIRRVYLNLCGKEPEILRTDSEFSVSLPLL